jgi:ubiquinone/menaquinone biosynthesis C-methylase UbiE
MESGKNPQTHAAAGHSEDYFGPYRDHWWNLDFIELTAKRLEWAKRRRVLEVGSGAGHWTRTFVRFLPPGASVTCIDRDPKWADPNQAWVKAMTGGPLTLRVQSADAYALPFPDGAFDFVTCQTVLIHADDPRRALREMIRVLEPGGLLLCVEPDNFAVYATSETALSRTETLEEETTAIRFALAQARGRIARGLGNYSIGGRLPGLFAACGLRTIQTRLSDRAISLYPTYDIPAQAALLSDLRQWHNAGADFAKDNVRLNYLAGGGEAETFEIEWARELLRRERFWTAVDANAYDEGGGCLVYLVSGVKALE